MNAPEIRPWLKNVELIGGEPCVDFVNSVSDCIGPAPVEQLRSYPDLLFWLERCGFLPAEESQRLQAVARRESEAAVALKHARRFRDAAWRVLTATVRDSVPAETDLIEVNKLLAKAYTHMQLAVRRGGFQLLRRDAGDDLEQVLWPVARSLAGFMTSGELAELRMCASATCGWLFVDRSRNRRRRWCSMRDCGNLAKQRRHRVRQTQPSETAVNAPVSKPGS